MSSHYLTPKQYIQRSFSAPNLSSEKIHIWSEPIVWDKFVLQPSPQRYVWLPTSIAEDMPFILDDINIQQDINPFEDSDFLDKIAKLNKQEDQFRECEERFRQIDKVLLDLKQRLSMI